VAHPEGSRAVQVGAAPARPPDELGEWLADAAAFEAAFEAAGADALCIDVAAEPEFDPLAVTAALAAVTCWLVAFAGVVAGLSGLVTQRLTVTPEGAVAAQSARVAVAAPWLVLLGVLALRAAVLFSVQ
jgi:hypothetical protein